MPTTKCTCNSQCPVHPPRRATFRKMTEALVNALNDLSILAGDSVGPSKASWQDVAGTAAVNLRVLASQLEQARLGNVWSRPD